MAMIKLSTGSYDLCDPSCNFPECVKIKRLMFEAVSLEKEWPEEGYASCPPELKGEFLKRYLAGKIKREG